MELVLPSNTFRQDLIEAARPWRESSYLLNPGACGLSVRDLV